MGLSCPPKYRPNDGKVECGCFRPALTATGCSTSRARGQLDDPNVAVFKVVAQQDGVVPIAASDAMSHDICDPASTGTIATWTLFYRT